MAKTYVNTVKYVIKASFDIKGVVEKPDIIGAIFGQSEGLLGDDLDLRELQKNGRIGRIEINPVQAMGTTKGEMFIPSSMDMVETSILAAAVETVDKVGPCEAMFKSIEIEDTRSLKRKEIIEKAKTLLRKLMTTQIPDSQELAEQVRADVRIAEVESYGADKLACGPGIENEETIIIVEGRADVINLLRHSIKNVIAMGGSKIPQTIIDLAKRKTVTLFVDGDRGGVLNVKKFEQLGEIDFVAKAPDGKEVEELTQKEIIMSLRRKIPVEQFLAAKPEEKSFHGKPFGKPAFQRQEFKREERIERFPPKKTFPERREFTERVSDEDKTQFEPFMKELKGTLQAKLLDKDMKEVETIPVRDLLVALDKTKGIESIVFDGIVTKRVVDEAKKNGIKTVVGVKKGKFPEEKDVKAIALTV